MKIRKPSLSPAILPSTNIPADVRRFDLPYLPEHRGQLEDAAFTHLLQGDNVEKLVAGENKDIGERNGENMVLSKAHKENEGELLFAADIVSNDEDADMLLTGDGFPDESSLVFPSFLRGNHSNKAFKDSQLVDGGSHDQACSRHYAPHGHSYSINSHDMLFCTENTGVFSDEAEMMQSDNKSAGGIPIALPLRQKKRTLSDAFSNVGTSHFVDDGLSVDDFIGIVDAAFRYTICDKPNKLRAGTKIHGNTMKNKLQSIYPTVWSPGYAQAVATRAALVPTLASSFSKFVSNARTDECKTKFGKPGGGQKAVETISTFLLETTQRGLHDPKAACKLKPLRRSSEKSIAIHEFDSAFDDCEFLEATQKE